MTTATVVGSGPNGLAAAVTLARHGVDVTVLEAAGEIGGGTRSGAYTVDGLLHDHCSAVHPFAAASPFLKSLELPRLGLTWRYAPVDLAHPLPSGRAAVLVRSVAQTAAGLGVDERAWIRLYARLSSHIDDVVSEVFQPPFHLPRHPVALARLGLPALAPATALARLFRTDKARALFGGCSAHSFQPLGRMTSAAMGVMFVAVNQRYGWPVAEGGSQRIAHALATALTECGGRIETGMPVRTMADLPPSDVTVFDLAPPAVASILGDRLPGRIRRAYRRYRYGPAAFKLDLAVAGGIPWTNQRCRHAGTVHVGGPFPETVAAERDVHAGRFPERPFVLVGQQYLADPGRSRGDVHPVYAYAHVPQGFSGDATDAILDRIESYAPGFRERIIAVTATSPAEMAAVNPNNVGGDVIGGAATPTQLLTRPRLAFDPYSLGVHGMFLCSAATPPGAGAHGMSGFNAARSALRHLRVPYQQSLLASRKDLSHA